MTIVLEFRHEIAAAPARVFAALTGPDLLARWFCDRAESVPAEGGALVLRWTGPGGSSEPFTGRWVEFRPPWACAYEGGHAGYPDGFAGRIAFALSARGEGTTLVARHTLPERPEYGPIAERYRGAWPRALARLTALLAGGSSGTSSVEAPAGADPDQLGE